MSSLPLPPGAARAGRARPAGGGLRPARPGLRRPRPGARLHVDRAGPLRAARPSTRSELDRFHLVVHDIGGPVGFELAAAVPERVRSLTVLNTIVDPDGFKRPWMMEPFALRGVRFAWLRTHDPARAGERSTTTPGIKRPPRGARRRGRRPPASAQAGRRRAVVPEGDAGLRADRREARALRLGPGGPLPGPGGVGRARPGPEAVRPGRAGPPRWPASTRSTRCRASTSSRRTRRRRSRSAWRPCAATASRG